MAQGKICRYCGNIIDINAQKCKYCKKDLNIEDTPDMFCTKCKAPVNVDDNFCQYCGAIFNIPDDLDKPVMHNISGIPYNIIILLTSFAISLAVTVFSTAGKDSTFGQNFIFGSIAFIVAEIFLYIYFLPSILAIENNHPNTFLIYICNLLFGITVVGWFVTLVSALSSEQNA